MEAEHCGTALVDLLDAHGVRAVFGLPGGQTMALYDAIDQGDRLQHIAVLDERSAAYAADAYARVTGLVGVCDATVGPGTTKLPSGLGEAFNSSIPIVALISDLPLATEARRYRGATSQALDQEALLQPVTKWVGVVRRSADLGPVVRRAFREASSGRPGPVAVILPQDVLDGPPPDRSQAEDINATRFGRYPSTPIPPLTDDLAAIETLMDRANRPLLVLGGGAKRPGIGTVAADLADRTGCAVATTLSGKGAVDERHPLAVGVLGSMGAPAALDAATEADLLVLAGTKWGSTTTAGWSLPRAEQRIVQIDVDAVELGRDRPVDALACADALTTLEALTPTEAERGEWRARIGTIREAWHDQRAALWASTARPIDPQRVMGELQRIINPDDVVIADASLSSGWVGTFLEVGPGGPRLLFPRGLAGLGFAIPATIGAAVAGARRVIAVLGDGAAPYAIGELATLVEREVPAVIVVLNNSSYGWIRWYRRVAFGRGWDQPDLPGTSFAAVAEAYGLEASRVDDPAELADAFRLQTQGPALIEVITSVWETPIAAHREAVESNQRAGY